MNKVIHKLKMLAITSSMLIKYEIAKVYGLIISFNDDKYKDLWLISERGIDARDNGYVFWEYICNNHPEINARFIIDNKSADYEKVRKLGKCVQYKSFEHYVMLSLAKYNVSTHIMGYTPNMIAFVWLDRILHIIKGKKIFLQHGIIKDDMLFNHYPHISVDIFNTSAKPEYEYIKNTYGHPEGTIRLLGMCRYDKLDADDRTKHQILVMPTWRQNISSQCSGYADFVKTDYYKKFNSLINNRDLLDFLEKNDLKLVFYPHIEFQKYLNLFKVGSDRVILGSFKEYDVQQLLIESKVLITDYSSVYFDFAYMNKPEIYYQFDKENYRKGHYAEGYFSYENDGFGPVVTEELEVIQEIKKIADNDWKADTQYTERMDKFFTLRDHNNCERVFKAIIALGK